MTKAPSLRRRVLTFVLGLTLVSLFSSILSIYQITGVARSLEAINSVVVPLGRNLTQMKADSQILRRELEERLAYSQWRQPFWKARPMPYWLQEVMQKSLDEVKALVNLPIDWADVETRNRWLTWSSQADQNFKRLVENSERLYHFLIADQQDQALGLYGQWIETIEFLVKHLDNGVKESDQWLAGSFEKADDRVKRLRLGLEMILAVVFIFSLLLLWFGERALRPLAELTSMVRSIAQRGLRKEDKADLSRLSVNRHDEIGRLAREFHLMATTLLERELTVEEQKRRLQEKQRQELDLEKRLRTAENMAAMGRLSAQVAHEIRNPLHAMGLEAEMALDMAQQYKDTDLKHSISSILEGVGRLEKITDNYLKLSRLSSGKRTRVNLADTLQRVLATYANVCENREIKVDWMCEAGSDTSVLADADLIEQVMGNLMRNSLQALEASARPEGEIRWTLGSSESGRVWLRIRDNGPGIAAEVKGRLFQPFVTSKAQGTGLGLSFAQKVLQEHGGEIQALELENGACFELIFPAFQPSEDTGVTAIADTDKLIAETGNGF